MRTYFNRKILAVIYIMIFCLTSGHSQVNVSEWAVSSGGNGWDIVNDIVCDHSAGIYITGCTYDSSTVGKHGKEPKSKPTNYIAKYDSTGKLLWKKQPISDLGYGSKLTITIDNKILVAGGCFSEKGNSKTENKKLGMFLACLDTLGNVLWSQEFIGTKLDFLTGLSNDPATGDIVLGGYFRDTLVFNKEKFISAGRSDAICIRFSATGTIKEIRIYGGKGDDRIQSVAFDPNGNCIIVGSFQREIKLNEKEKFNLAQNNETGLFIVRLDPMGNSLGSIFFGHGRKLSVTSILVNNQKTFITGSFSEKGLVLGTELSSKGSDDIFLALLDAEMKLLWIKQIGGPRKDRPAGLIEVDKELVLCGSFCTTLTVDSLAILSANENPDIFAVGIKQSGSISWIRSFGGQMDDFPKCMSSAANYIYVAGSFRGTMALGTSDVTSKGEEDIFIARLENCSEKKPDFRNPETYCSGGEITLNAGGEFLSYNWNNGVSTQPLYTVSNEGTYPLALISRNGCKIFDTINVKELPPVDVSIGNDTVIADTNYISLSVPGIYSTYCWSNEDSTRSITLFGSDLNIGMNKIWVEVTTMDSCVGYDELNITVIKTNKDEVTEWISKACMLFPNPSDDRITVLFKFSMDDLVLQIYNQLGIVVTKRSFTRYTAFDPVIFDLGALPPGQYTFTASTAGSFITKKIILQ